MAHFPFLPAKRKTRAPRVYVPNGEPISFEIENQRMPAMLQKISITGGLAQSNIPAAEHIFAELRVNTTSGPVRGLVQFLRPTKSGRTYQLPFRFVALDEIHETRLKKTLEMMQKQGLGE